MTCQGDTVIVKLGGAAITNKKGLRQLAPDSQLNDTLDQVAIAHQSLSAINKRLILVHGAGSYGHPQAIKYKLKGGWKEKGANPTAEYRKGYSHIRRCVLDLSHSIISRLEDRDVPVLALHPMDYMEAVDGENTDTHHYKRLAQRTLQYLEMGFVPVLHGDAVLDVVRGCTIISGDTLLYQLSKLLPFVTRCLFITDVSGIYEADPKLNLPQSSRIVSHVKVTDKEMEYSTDQEHSLDVTGGMQGKVKWAKKIASLQHENNHSTETIICRWGSKEALDMMMLKSCMNEDGTVKSTYTLTLFT
ncbi:Aspartate/glutamate/uridylate kinase [Pilobolus umbonatus]|nr:Aspartate/glutamate/uridylate kinase [Pilobolus umbonatus]